MTLKEKIEWRKAETKSWAQGNPVAWPEVPEEDQSELRLVKRGSNFYLVPLSRLHERYK